MTGTEDKLGGRLPLLAPDRLHGEQRALYDQLKSTLVAWADEKGFKGDTMDGRLIGPFNPFLYSVGITPGFLNWMQADSSRTSLSKRVHETVILTVGTIWKSPYELYSHSAVARSVGISDKAIQALVSGMPPIDLSSKEVIAHRFAKQITIERQVDDALYQEALGAFGATGLVDMTYLIGMYLMTCAMLNVFTIPAPE